MLRFRYEGARTAEALAEFVNKEGGITEWIFCYLLNYAALGGVCFFVIVLILCMIST